MSEQTTSLFEALQEHSKSGPMPFHMPGHKRNTTLGPYLKALGAQWDMTEIPGFDDLHDAQGILAQAMERCRALYGAEQSFFLVNGSTGGLLAAIRSSTRRGQRVLVARNCHKAVYHALELCSLNPIFLQPEVLPEFGCAASITPLQVEEALARWDDIRLVILTSPSYEGVVSDIAEICRVAHARGVPVLVDEAHGAHLGFHPAFPPSALEGGADLVVQSFHKTLPSLTQTGVLHVNGNRIHRQELARNLGMFQTSSPSYLLMASIDSCTQLLSQHGEKLFSAWAQRLEDFYRQIQDLEHLQVLGWGKQGRELPPGAFGLDPSKIVISTRGLSLTGTKLLDILAENYKLQLEMALEDYAIAMTGMGDTPAMLESLSKALLEIDQDWQKAPQADGNLPPLPLPEQVLSLESALSKEVTVCTGAAAVGSISAAYLWAYPPGVPLLIPGERIEPLLVERVEAMKRAGVHLIASKGTPGEQWAVCSE